MDFARQSFQHPVDDSVPPGTDITIKDCTVAVKQGVADTLDQIFIQRVSPDGITALDSGHT
ncbi:hypothetical protein GCM10023166_24910 [Paeniglutamicibacter cryotolerans]